MSASSSDKFHTAFVAPLIPSLQVGASTSVCGFLLGGGIGILRSAHPGLVAIFTGTQFFVLGGSFLYTREALLAIGFSERTKRADLVSSSIAGAVSGAAAGAFYGRVNSAAGALLVGTAGYLGQKHILAKADTRSITRDERPLFDRLIDSRLMPFKSISNSEYETMLKEKLLKVEAEISLIDEKLAAFHNKESADSTNLNRARSKG